MSIGKISAVKRVNGLVFRTTVFAMFSLAFFGGASLAQPMNNSDISSYPASNQRSAGPNEPDSTSGTAASTYRLPTGGPVVSGTTSSRKPVVYDPEAGAVPSTNHVDESEAAGSGNGQIPVSR